MPSVTKNGNTMLEFLLKLRFARPLVVFKLNDLEAKHIVFISSFGSFRSQSLAFRAKDLAT